jgi:hypothetical protein
MDKHAPPQAQNAVKQSRLISRFIAEIQLAAMIQFNAVLEAYGGISVSLDRTMVLIVILRADLPWHCDMSQTAASGARPVRGISINAIAASMGRPFETMRRHANALIAAGICTRSKRGVVLSPDFATSPQLIGAIRYVHDLMVQLIDYLHAHGVALPQARTDVPYRPQETIAATLDLSLASVEYLDPYFEDWLGMVIVNAVMAANAHPISRDPILAKRYGEIDTVPPESLRHPITGTQLAKALRLPYSTVQRQVKRAIVCGQLKRVEGGIMVTESQLNAAAVRIVGPAAAIRAGRVFGRLVSGGFRFDCPRICYLDGHRDLLDFD